MCVMNVMSVMRVVINPMTGGTYASPVLVAPQVAIGALGKVQKLPRYDNNGKKKKLTCLQI